MRSILLAGSALFALVALAQPAQAKMEINMGGFTSVQAGLFDNDTANDSQRDFRSKSEITIKVKDRADNGMEYGTNITLIASADQTTNARRAGIFASGRLGRIEMGDLDGVSSQLSILAPTVGVGQIAGSYVNFMSQSARPSGSVVDTGGGMIRPADTDQATKVTYLTPRINGFQAGVSYAPEVDNEARGEQVQLSDTVGKQHDALEAGLNYRAQFDKDWTVRSGLVISNAAAKDGTREGVNAWGLGAQLSYKKVTFGGSYVDNNDSNNLINTVDDRETSWNIGARYQSGAWGTAINYIADDYNSRGGNGTDTSGGTYNAIVFGGTYKIADGLTTGADLAFFDRNKVTGTDQNGYVLVIETKAAF